MKKHWIVLLMSLSAASCALAQVTVKDAWIRATVPAAKAGGAFMQLQSAQDARLVEVRSPVAGTVEIHQMEMSGETMKMHAIAGVDLASGGYHVMLLDLKHQLKDGEMVPLTLLIQNKNKKAETLTINVPVKPLNYTAPAR